MTHAMADSNKTVEDAVDSLEAQMKENCGYLVDRRSFFTLFRDVIALFFTVIFLFLFGKIPEFVLSLFPASIVAQVRKSLFISIFHKSFYC